MTNQDLATLLEKDQTRNKLVSLLERDFPRHRNRAEDWASEAIKYGLRKARNVEVANGRGVLAYIMEVGPLLASKDLEREITRRNTLQGLPKPSKQRDPMRHTDYKVDLEKAIRLTTGERRMQQSLWHIHFEDWTWDEVIEALPVDVNPETWRKRIMRTNAELQTRLRSYGYRG
jgi:hypothetical protein